MSKKKVALWAIYDFANSIAVAVFFLYFSQWLVIEHGVADIWYNLIFVGSTILLLASGPVTGIIADKLGKRMPFLLVTTGLQFLALLAASILAIAFPATKTVVLMAALAFMIGNYFYQFTLIFYNSLLTEIAPPRLQGRVSGIGQASNWMGMIAGVAIALPLISGAWFLFGNPGRAQTFLPATIAFLIFSLPMLLFFKETKKLPGIFISVTSEYKHYFNSFKQLLRRPGVGRFLLSLFFFNDAILTVENNLPILFEQVFKVSDKIKSLIAVGILVTSAIGALGGGWLADKIGLKKSLIMILSLWTVLFPILGLIKNFPIFAGFCIILGLLYGATWSVTRAVMSRLSPENEVNHAFSYYTMAERFATFIGPVAWGLITTLLIRSGPIRYRIALISMSVFIVVGLIIARKIPLQKPESV